MGGIYLIVCSANGKVYVGSAKNLHTRWGVHQKQLNLQKHFNKHLQRAWVLYGASAFSYIIHEELGEYDRKMFFERENFWIDSFRSVGITLFNIARAEGGWGEDTHLRKNEIVKKIRASLMRTMQSLSDEERKRKYGHLKGTPLPEDRKMHLSAFWKNKPKSAQTKQKMRLAQLNMPADVQHQKVVNMSKVGRGRAGSIPANAKQIVFRGKTYTSAPQCRRETGLSMHEILKEVYGPDYRKQKKTPL